MPIHASIPDYRITDHLRERYIERSNKKFFHLNECRNRSGCKKCFNLIYDIKELITSNRRTIDTEIRSRLYQAKEDRSYVNNTEFMSKYYEKYGYDHQIRFLVNEDLVFVCVEDPDGTKAIPTCLVASRHIAVKHKKFKKAIV